MLLTVNILHDSKDELFHRFDSLDYLCRLNILTHISSWKLFCKNFRTWKIIVSLVKFALGDMG